MDYAQYTLDDFLADDRFKRWVLHPDSEEENQFWKSFIQKNPAQKTTVIEAKRLILLLATKDNVSDENRQIEKIWNRVATSTGYETPKTTRVVFWQRPAKVAAVIALLIVGTVAGYWLVFQSQEMQQVSTPYGITKTITLPDSSVVTLNANSSITYRKRWGDDEFREVWLEGEAFFQVRHLAENENIPLPQRDVSQPNHRFLVHTDNLNVEVLGTEFNVNSRRADNTSVVLNSGKVKLSSVAENLQVQLLPGERAEYRKDEKKIAKQVVDTDVYTAWRKQQYVFKGTTVEEIARIIEDDHGLKVEVDEAVKDRTFSASVPSDTLDMLLGLLSQTLHVEVVQTQQQIKILPGK